MPTSTDSVFALDTDKDVPAALAALQSALAGKQFGVLWQLDINEKLAEKGLEPVAPFYVLEVCSAPRAQKALRTDQQVGYFLPCKLVVYRDEVSGRTRIGLQRPRLMAELVGNPQLLPLAQEVDQLLREAVTEAAQS